MVVDIILGAYILELSGKLLDCYNILNIYEKPLSYNLTIIVSIFSISNHGNRKILQLGKKIIWKKAVK